MAGLTRPNRSQPPLLDLWRWVLVAMRFMKMLAIIQMADTTTGMMPMILPALVIPRPAGSITPASICARSLLPMTQAMMPQIPQHTRPIMPRARIEPPRCGFIIGA